MRQFPLANLFQTGLANAYRATYAWVFIIIYVITRQPNLKFWLYTFQILTLFWPINFLRLQLQNNSAVGVEVKPEVHSCTLSFDIKQKFGCLTSGMIYW